MEEECSKFLFLFSIFVLLLGLFLFSLFCFSILLQFSFSLCIILLGFLVLFICFVCHFHFFCLKAVIRFPTTVMGIELKYCSFD